ncbi:MAG: pseudouridine synthase, partial [Spirochaetota bacterium]
MEHKSVRINRFLASCGLGSRRKCESYVTEGRVTINGEVPGLSATVDPKKDTVLLDGKPLTTVHIAYYVMLHKPKGYITSVGDPFNRRTVRDLVDEKYWEAGVFPVGRLDKDTEGLLLLTNDGETAHRLMHPSFECSKTYQVTLDRPLEEKDRMKVESGIRLREFHAQPCSITNASAGGTRFELTITEGKKRQIRIVFKSLHYKVTHLKRISLGPLHLGHLPKGHLRDLHK